jgi:cytochrome c oxidase subunit IV
MDPTDRLFARATALALFGVGLLYILTTTAGFVIVGGLQAPIVDPAYAVMELLILVEAPLIVAPFAAVHRYAAPSRRSFSLAAFGLVVLMTALTLGVHFVLLTVGRQVDPSLMPGFDRFLSFKWPSVVYALDIVAWDFCFGLALLFAALVFTGRGLQRAVRIGLVVAGVLCLAGLLGVVTANMQIRNIGIVGYAIVFPAVTLLIARVFGRADTC